MTENENLIGGAGRRVLRRPVTVWRQATPDIRRRLQLGLAAIWLLDAALQYQPFMFSRGFSALLAGTSQGNPRAVAAPITWAAGIITHQPVLTNAVFATAQLAIAFGIAWRPTVKAALVASVVWSLAVWWLGEGLGGVLTPAASPVNGAPGAVIIYVLLAVLLWPAERDGPAPAFAAAHWAGAWPARALWLTLWGSLAYFAVDSANRTPQGLHDLISQSAAGQPAWLASLNGHIASLLAGHGAPVSVGLAVLLGVIAIGVFLPAPAAHAAVVLAIVTAAVIWVAGEDLGGILTGAGTDPNSGLLLILLAVAYWPARGTRSGDDALR